MVDGVEVVGVDGLDDVARLVAGPRGRTAGAARRRPSIAGLGRRGWHGTAPPAGGVRHHGARGLAPADLADVRGQPMARWALEVALAGGHDLLLVGSPGAGKTLLARTVPSLLPPLDDREAQEVAVIRSVAGLRPGRASGACGRSARPTTRPPTRRWWAAGRCSQPGLVTLAHRGVLFLDELAEFDRNVLDALRQPLEDGTVEIARAHGHVRYPARLQLIAAMNPCRCGWYGEPDAPVGCRPDEAGAYQRRVSGPLLDRIDLRVVHEPGRRRRCSSKAPRRSRASSRRGAHRRGPAPSPWPATRRAERPAARRPPARTRAVDGAAPLRRLLTELSTSAGMTARGIHRALRVARTIADLAGERSRRCEAVLGGGRAPGRAASADGLARMTGRRDGADGVDRARARRRGGRAAGAPRFVGGVRGRRGDCWRWPRRLDAASFGGSGVRPRRTSGLRRGRRIRAGSARDPAALERRLRPWTRGS